MDEIYSCNTLSLTYSHPTAWSARISPLINHPSAPAPPVSARTRRFRSPKPPPLQKPKASPPGDQGRPRVQGGPPSGQSASIEDRRRANQRPGEAARRQSTSSPRGQGRPPAASRRRRRADNRAGHDRAGPRLRKAATAEAVTGRAYRRRSRRGATAWRGAKNVEAMPHAVGTAHPAAAPASLSPSVSPRPRCCHHGTGI